MNGKATLKRLEGLAQRRQRPRDELERRERERLDAMTDDELARHVELLAQALLTLGEAGALGDVLQDEGLELEALELLNTAEL